MSPALFLLLLSVPEAADGYQPEIRQAYLIRALRAVETADPQKLGDAVNYVSTMDRNKCRSSFRRLRVQCLIEAAQRNCRSLRDQEKKEQCTLYSDIIVTSALGEKQLISESRRYQIMQEHRDYRSALRAELRRIYGNLAAGFRASEHHGCASNDVTCVARAIDAYCLDQSDRRNLAWQHCAAGLVWFIGTAKMAGER